MEHSFNFMAKTFVEAFDSLEKLKNTLGLIFKGGNLAVGVKVQFKVLNNISEITNWLAENDTIVDS